MLEPLGDIIRRRRQECNLSQEALSRRAGVSRRHLAMLESNSANVSVQIVVRIARALELTELAIGDLCLRAAPPETAVLLEALHAVHAAKQAVAEAAAGLEAWDAKLDESAKTLAALMRRALSSAGSGRELIDAARRVEQEGISAFDDALADLASPAAAPPRREPAAPAPAARRRAR